MSFPLPLGESGRRPGEETESLGFLRQWHPASLQNLAAHFVKRAHHVVVGNSKHTRAVVFQNLLPTNVRLAAFIVAVAIQFHDQVVLHAQEVDDVLPNWYLAARLPSGETSIRNEAPESPFGTAGVPSEIAQAMCLEFMVFDRSGHGFGRRHLL